MLVRVSNIEAFRRWKESEDQDVSDLIRFLTTDEPTPAMIAGTAFHKALELATPGDYEQLEADGHTFVFTDGCLSLPEIREVRAYGQFGPLKVTGQCDLLDGVRIVDHKTTARFDAERFLSGYQWRYYLELFGAQVFRWNVFEIREVAPMAFSVSPPQILEAYRYNGMRRDCEQLALEYHGFAEHHLPERIAARMAVQVVLLQRLIE